MKRWVHHHHHNSFILVLSLGRGANVLLSNIIRVEVITCVCNRGAAARTTRAPRLIIKLKCLARNSTEKEREHKQNPPRRLPLEKSNALTGLWKPNKQKRNPHVSGSVSVCLRLSHTRAAIIYSQSVRCHTFILTGFKSQLIIVTTNASFSLSWARAHTRKWTQRVFAVSGFSAKAWREDATACQSGILN
jgi:hypothetical protein